jgi:hypothetical protein
MSFRPPITADGEKAELADGCCVVFCSIPQLLLDTVFHAPEGGLGLQAYISSTNTVFLFVAICVAYGMVSWWEGGHLSE